MEKYRDTVERKFSEDTVAMVKEYLGNLYGEAKIFIEEAGDGGAWISLSDGRLHVKSTNVRSTYTENSKDNFFGEKMTPNADMERGLYVDGVFYTEKWLEENPEWLAERGLRLEIVSEDRCVDGFDDEGNVVGDDALLLHGLVATQIKDEFDKLKETFENYGGAIMYDHFADGPNAGMVDMVENEFGLIKGQDLIEFDALDAIFAKKEVDETIDPSLAADGDVFEKVVSNAELAGIRKASLTREHVKVNVKPAGMTTEQLYRVITKGVMTQAKDMFAK